MIWIHRLAIVWGRPGFQGLGAREAQLYLLAHRLPLRLDRRGRARLRPQYFAGVDARGEPRWSALALGLSDDVASAVAIDRAGRLAAGDARGVIVGVPGGPMRRVALRGGVRDLAFWGPGREPELLAATELGSRLGPALARAAPAAAVALLLARQAQRPAARG